MKLRSFVTITFAVAVMSLPAAAAAANPLTTPVVPCTGATGSTPCTLCHLVTLAQNVLNVGIYLFFSIGAVVIFIAGIMMATAGGSEQKWSRAKGRLGGVAKGALVILIGYLVINTFFSTLTGSTWWRSICAAHPSA